MRLKRKPSIFRLVLIGSLLCVTLVTAIILRIAGIAKGDFEAQFIGTEQMETVSVINMLDKDISHAAGRMGDIVVNSYVQQASLYLENRRFSMQLQTAIHQIQSELRSLVNSSSFSWDAALYFPHSSRRLTASGMTSFGEDTSAWIERLMKMQSPAIIDDALTLRMATPFSYYQDYESISSLLVCRLDIAGLRAYLRDFSQAGSDTQFAAWALDARGEPLLAAAHTELRMEDMAPLLAGLPRDAQQGHGVVTIDGEGHLVTWQRSKIIPDFVLLQVTRAVGMSEQIGSFISRIVLGYCAVALVLLLLLSIASLLFGRPIAHMSEALREFNEGNLSARIGESHWQEFQGMYGRFDSMAQHIQTLIESEYTLRMLHFQAELKQIQYQINPHFLYNTYFILRSMLYEEETEQAIQLAELLGLYLRYITLSSHEYALLDEEITHTRTYAQIQQYRFGSRVDIRFAECPAPCRMMRVPRLILQPLVENAFVHGILQNVGQGIISVSFETDGDDLLIHVDDNGEHTDDAAVEALRARMAASERDLALEGVALVNIHKRLQMVYHSGNGLSVARSELSGLRVTLRIQWKGVQDV